jgi:hypothetical protein
MICQKIRELQGQLQTPHLRLAGVCGAKGLPLGLAKSGLALMSIAARRQSLDLRVLHRNLRTCSFDLPGADGLHMTVNLTFSCAERFVGV